MLIDIAFYIIGIIVWAVYFLFAAISYLIPVETIPALNNFFGYAGYLQGYLPVVAVPSYSGLVHTVGILDLIVWSINIFIAYFTIKLILFVYSLFRGKHHELPKAHESK